MFGLGEKRAVTCASAFAGIAIGLEILPLFWGRSFAIDWTNHAWMVEYFRNYLINFGNFPTTFDTTQTLGNPSPLFYGVFLYPLLSLIAVATGADGALRATSIVLIVAPFVTFSFLFQRLVKFKGTAILLAVVANSSVYQMTNLYNRSAMTEFFANQLLLVGLSLCMDGLLSSTRTISSRISLGCASICIAAGTHPITLYTFAIFVTPVAALGLLAIRKKIRLANFSFMLGLLTLTAVILVPHIFAIIKYNSGFQITTTSVLSGKLHYFPTSIDSTMGRFGLFYFDPRVAAAGIGATSTPFLDAPFSVPLLLILCVVGYRLLFTGSRRSAMIVIPAILVAWSLIYLSRSPHGAAVGVFDGSAAADAKDGLIFVILSPIQFAYRLAGVWQLSILTSLVLSLALLKSKELVWFKYLDHISIAAAILSLALLSQKFLSTNLEYRQYPQFYKAFHQQDLNAINADTAILLNYNEYKKMVSTTTAYPRLFYGQLGYSTPGNLKSTPANSDMEKKVLSFVKWGIQTNVDCSAPCLIKTNILPSPSNSVVVDGLVPSQMYLSSTGTIDIQLNAGSHQIKIQRLGKYITAIKISIWAAIAFLIFSLVYFLCILLGKSFAGYQTQRPKET